MNLAATKTALMEERARLLAERDQIEDSDAEHRQSDEIGELSDYSDHPGDAATNTFERERDFALVENLDGLLQKVDRALAKLEEGSYGICDRCGKPIAPERLEAMPAASLCLACQDVEDGI